MVEPNFRNKYLSYWVEYWLAHKFPSDETSAGSDILTLNATETSTVEMLATKSSDGSFVVMVANHAPRSTTEINGSGAPRTVVVDVSSPGTFTTASQLTIDTNTNLTNGPVEVSITPSQKLQVALSGYGVTFVMLTP